MRRGARALTTAAVVLALALPGSSEVDRVAETAAFAERAATGATDAVAALVRRLHDGDARVRLHAERGLARAGAASVAPLLEALRRREDDPGRAHIARQLGRVGPFARPAIPALRALLAAPDSEAAGAAAYALGRVRAWEAVPDLAQAYAASRTIDRQREIARALRAMGSDQGLRDARTGLAASLEREVAVADPATRAAHVAYALALYRAVRTDGEAELPTLRRLGVLIPGLVEALGAADVKVARQAAQALALAGRSADPAVPGLERLVGHPELHRIAMDTLRAIGTPDAERVVAEREAFERLEKRVRTVSFGRDPRHRTELLPFRVAGSAEDGLRMWARFPHPDPEPAAPTHVVIVLESTSMEPRFADVTTVHWNADGASLPMPGLERSWSRSQIGGVIEQVSGRMPVDEFHALARARVLRASAGGVAFTLDADDQAALRHFAGRIPKDRP